MKDMENQPIVTLNNLLDHDARKFTSDEVQLERKLPDWIKLASSLKLKIILEKYLDLVQQHIRKMDVFFTEENLNYLSLESSVMRAFIEETDGKLSMCSGAEVKDVCLLAGIQRINHFKISTYGTAAAFANDLEIRHAADIFHELEINEKQIDDRLSQLAEHNINIKAIAPLLLRK